MRKMFLIPVFLLLLSTLLPAVQRGEEERGSMEFWMNLKVYDEKGQLVKEVMKRDPLTNQTVAFIMLLVQQGGEWRPTKDIDGNSVSFTRGTSTDVTMTHHGPTRIWIGTGTTTTPAYTDYKLEAPLQVTTASQPSLSIIGNRMNISISASFSFSAQYTITEVGLDTYMKCNNDFYCGRYFLLAHDKLSSSITVYPGWSLTVTYIIWINPGV